MSAPVAVAVVGSVNVDTVIEVPRNPLPGETLMAKGFSTAPGGKGLNQALAAASVVSTALLAAVGYEARLAFQVLNSAAVDTSWVTKHDQITGRAFIWLTPSGENSISVVAGANRMLSATSVSE